MIGDYEWAGGREAVLRFGPADGPIVIAALPLFEEANRTRAFAVAILRGLARRGIAGVLPELPATGESLLPTEQASITAMRAAYAAMAAERPSYALGVRSGVLLDTQAAVRGRWHLTPQDGAGVLRELTRIRQAEVGELKLTDLWFIDADAPDEADPPVAIAGNLISPRLLTELMSASPIDDGVRRVVRQESDPLPADRKMPGAPLWRRAEPGNDLALVELVADDIAEWVRTCES